MTEIGRQAGARALAAMKGYQRPPGVPPEPATMEEKVVATIMERVIMDWFGRDEVTEGYVTKGEANMVAREILMLCAKYGLEFQWRSH